MSMLNYPLYEFITTVPICVETNTLAQVLGIFEREQCDRLVVVNEQQCPIGFVYSASLIPHLVNGYQCEQGSTCLDLQQPLSALGGVLISPIETLPSVWNVEQFGLYLHSQKSQTNINFNWALLDIEGKFLGLLDSPHLLQFLANLSTGIATDKGACATASTAHSHSVELGGVDALIKLLERLPWPLMLQTASGEVVTQNPAWSQQLGVVRDPEGVRQEVQAILAASGSEGISGLGETRSFPYSGFRTDRMPASAHFQDSAMGNEHYPTNYVNSCAVQPTSVTVYPNALSVLSEEVPSGLPSLPRLTPPVLDKINEQLSESDAYSSHRCFLDNQLGTCTCVVPGENGQERVWQFAKIPLDSPELKILNAESETALNTEVMNCLSSDLKLSKDLWLVLATDVTEQQQLCKELAAKNADLIQLNRLKDEFLACISHELKTPLTAVLGLSSLLKDQMLGELNERQARYAGLIHQSGRHLMSVVNDILDLTRMETGQMELTLEPVEIRAVCDRALSEAKAIHNGTSKASSQTKLPKESLPDHQFTLSIEPGLDRMVADDLRLRQMLIHLLSNALKFTETGGEIGLLVSRWEGWIAFTVWDTGIGIPERQQHLIFQKFQQLENPLTRQFEGTGLGLVLTRALARLHGGDVSFLSKEGKGSHFTLLLPPSPPPDFRQAMSDLGLENNITSGEFAPHGNASGEKRGKPTPSTAQSHTNILQNPKSKIQNSHPNRLVLVVEAVARYIESLTEQLTSLGYRVVIARSGCEALEKARRLQPKAVFLNPVLPLLSGWDVLTLLKSDTATRHIPAIITATRAEREHAFSNRADGFLSLPVEQQALEPLLTSLCGKTQVQQSSSDGSENTSNSAPLRILRLVEPQPSPQYATTDASPLSHPALCNHRVLEVDDLDQAELLARVWQLDVVLLDATIPDPLAYLQKLSQRPRLAALPLVTCDVATTQAASQVSGLSVFPCLVPVSQDKDGHISTKDPLLSVLQIAAGVLCPPSLLVVDLATLPDLRLPSTLPTPNSHAGQGGEWFCALVQYLQTAGFKAAMARSWAEVLQQVRHQSIDLLLICLGELSIDSDALAALKALEPFSEDLPPVLVLDRRLSHIEVNQQFERGEEFLPSLCEDCFSSDLVESNVAELPENSFVAMSEENPLRLYATEILPPSLSMEELLDRIHSVLSAEG